MIRWPLIGAAAIITGWCSGFSVGLAEAEPQARATVQSHGNLLAGKSYTAMQALRPGDEYEIKFVRKQIRLVPVGEEDRDACSGETHGNVIKPRLVVVEERSPCAPGGTGPEPLGELVARHFRSGHQGLPKALLRRRGWRRQRERVPMAGSGRGEVAESHCAHQTSDLDDGIGGCRKTCRGVVDGHEGA